MEVATGSDTATPPADSGPSLPMGQCKTTPSATAGMLRLALRPLQISGDVSAVGPGKSPTGFTEIRFVPGTTNEVFVAQKGARINHFRIEGNTATLIRRYTVPNVFAQEDCGLITFAFDPDYQTNKYVYAGYCTSATTSKVARFTVGETLTGAVDIISFSEPQSSSAYHTVGTAGFDRDKNMWLLHGEFFRGENAQNLNTPLGKLLRFIPSRTPGMGGNTPAQGNPFIGMAGRNPLVYAYGLRSPWRGYLDSRGRYLFGDVGNQTAEELNLVTAPGQNFGWNGSQAGTCSNCPGLTNPISTYRTANDPYEGQGEEVLEGRPRRSIWVGVQYQDCGNDRYGGDMTGVYLFGDLFAGWVRGVVIDDSGRKVTDRHLASLDGLSSWAQGPDGYLYAARFGPYGDHLTGLNIGLYRVERAP